MMVLKRSSFSLMLCFLLVFTMVFVLSGNTEAVTAEEAGNATINTTTDGALQSLPNGAVLVADDGTETISNDLLTDWATGQYSYIKLYGDDTLVMNGENVVIDLSGNDLLVSGSGNIRAFDTANDTFDESSCGVILNSGSVTFTEAVTAPNGIRYITVSESNKVTVHRLDMELSVVSLRTSAAGIYYKAQYNCDRVLEEKVQSYGMIVSVDNMPGADFRKDPGDINQYTVAAEPFRSGRVISSGSVFGIIKESRNADMNDRYARIPIYTNAYIDFGNGPIVADVKNAGKTVLDADFTGVALSLYDVMFKLDSAYNSYNTFARTQLDNFYIQWKEKGMDWAFENIGQTVGTTDGVDNSDIELKFAPGTTDAECPVCKKKVTWTALTVKEGAQNINGHYYLTQDLVFENDGDAFFYNGTRDTTLCVHLNGHNLTATKTRVLHGSSGRANIMGNGIVSGYQKTANYAATVQVNNLVATQSVNLYGGTYKKTENSNANAASVGIADAGGNLKIYEGATVENNGSVAIIVRAPTRTVDSLLGLYGCTVNGDVKLTGVSADIDNRITTELLDCNISGNVDISTGNDVYLSGKPVISSVTLHDEVRLNTMALTKGASIGIATEGVFTANSASVKNYTGYFYGTKAASKITVQDNALHCGPDYTGDLVFAEGTTDAMCPVCSEVVTWTPVDGTVAVDNSVAKVQQHYYLTNDVTFTAAAGVTAFLSPGNGDYSVCFHLNGHNFTGTNTRFVYGGTSTVNVMGSGTVTGSRSDVYTYGSTVQINTTNIKGTVNLYGGTWKQAEGGKYANDYVISISNNGGTVNIFKDAVVEANSNGNAIYTGFCSYRDSILNIYGTVKGNVYAAGATQEKGFVSYLLVDDGTVTGTMDINGVNTLTVRRAANIGLLDMEQTSKVTLDAMSQGAKINVSQEGVFTEPHTSAADWVEYFHAANGNDLIIAENDMLRYKVDYTAKIYPDADGKAYCPVCKESVVWKALTDDSAAQNLNGHYYLLDDLLFEKTGSGYIWNETKDTSLCLHLNGNNITATKTYAIFGSSGYVNIMGSGEVSGYNATQNDGAAVRLNNTVATNGVSLYSGTYKAHNPNGLQSVISLSANGGTIKLYEDALLNAGENGLAIYATAANQRNKELGLYGTTVIGDIVLSGVAEGSGKTSSMVIKDSNITGEVSVSGENAVTITGGTKIGKLSLAEGVTVNFEDVEDSMDITVSADGQFTPAMEQADAWLKHITCADEGDWIVVRDKAFYQEKKQEITVATDADKVALDATYKGKTVKYGEMHDHTNATLRADGTKSLAQWKAEMDRLGMDFATIVDHGQSQHMYHQDWDETYFVGGSEPGTAITDSKAAKRSPHYNMIFSDPAQLEALVEKWSHRYTISRSAEENAKFTPDLPGILFTYPSFTTAQFSQLAKDVYEYGGLFVLVHPKEKHAYIDSEDPLDYFFADYTGMEINTGADGNMTAQYNEEAYQLWVDLLEMGKKIWATSGSDKHNMPNLTALTTMYTEKDHCDTYIEHMRAGNMAPGWVGIRMNVNGTAMGGETDFTGKRLQFSVGDIYNKDVTDAYNTAPAYVEGHSYCVRLYDDGGLLMESSIDPTQMNYFAIDCDETAKFYRVVVWDETAQTRVGVGNPIWNTTIVAE